MYILYFIYPVKRLVATDCNQSFNVFRNFLSWGNQQPNQPQNGATTTNGPVVFSCIWFSFSLFSGLCNWTCKHHEDWSWWWHLQMCQQQQLWSWEWGGGRNQVVQDFLGDVVCPWGGGESNGRNLNLTPSVCKSSLVRFFGPKRDNHGLQPVVTTASFADNWTELCRTGSTQSSCRIPTGFNQSSSRPVETSLNRSYLESKLVFLYYKTIYLSKVLRHVLSGHHSHPVLSSCCHRVCPLSCCVSPMMINDVGHLSFCCHTTDSDMAPGLVVRSGNGGGLVVAYLSWQREITQDGDDAQCFIVPALHSLSAPTLPVVAMLPSPLFMPWCEEVGERTRVVVVAPSCVHWVIVACHCWVIVPCCCWAIVPCHHQLSHVHWWEVGCVGPMMVTDVIIRHLVATSLSVMWHLDSWSEEGGGGIVLDYLG